jgi:hypothetical protein
MRKLSVFIGIAGIFGTLMTSQAYAVEVNQVETYTFDIFVPCANENVHFIVSNHIISNSRINKNGRIEFMRHENLMGVSGIGESGEKYQLVSTTKENSGWDTTDGYPLIFTTLQNFHIQGMGLGKVYSIYMRRHYTINANGELTSNIDDFIVEGYCK